MLHKNKIKNIFIVIQKNTFVLEKILFKNEITPLITINAVVNSITPI